MIRILCFCGFTGNKHSFSQELSRLRSICKDNCRIWLHLTLLLIFLDPPFIVEPIDTPMSDFGAREATGWKRELTSQTTPRAWFAGDKDWHGEKGFAEGLRYVHDYLIRSEPFDAFLAFSSGATLANVVMAFLMNEGRHYDPNFPPHPRLYKPRFHIICSGLFIGRISSPNPKYTPLFPLPATLPTVHIIGKNDTILVHKDSMFLAGLCENKRIEWHLGDHFVPMKASWRGFFQAYIESFLPGGSNGQGIPEPNEFSPALITKSRSPVAYQNGASDPYEKHFMPLPSIPVACPRMPHEDNLGKTSGKTGNFREARFWNGDELKIEVE